MRPMAMRIAAPQSTRKIDRNAGSLGSSSGTRSSAAECAIVAAARAIRPSGPATAPGGRPCSPRRAAGCKSSRAPPPRRRRTRGRRLRSRGRPAGVSGGGRRCRCSCPSSSGRRRDRGTALGRGRKALLPGRPQRRGRARLSTATGRSGRRATRWTRSGSARPAASVPRLRTGGGPPCQPAQNGANQTKPASRARSPIRPAGRANEVTRPAAASARPATTAKAAARPDAPRIGREFALLPRDAQGAQAVGERDCTGDESSEVRRADRDVRHRPIVALCTTPTLVLATMPPSRQPRCDRPQPVVPWARSRLQGVRPWTG